MKKTSTRSLILTSVSLLSLTVGYTFGQGMPQTQPAQASNTKTLSRLNDDFIKISEQVTPAVVSIAMTKRVKSKRNHYSDPELEEFFRFFGRQPPQSPQQEKKQSGVGSGVIVDAAKGLVLTNNHVVEGADDIKITLSDKRSFKATIVGTDPKTDLAVIKILGAKDLKEVAIGDSGNMEVGEWVLAIGNPFGLSSTVTAGIISAKGRANVGVADFEDFIQTDAAINPGNSGGALVNIKGELIGINTAIATRSRGYMGIGFAIPTKMAQRVMKSLISKGKVSRSQLGVFIQPLDEPMALSLGLKDVRKGILVTGIVKGSPAEKAGLKKYDVILKLDGHPVNDTNNFRNRIALSKPGSTKTMEVLRDGKTKTIRPVLREMSVNRKSTKERIAPELTSKLGFEANDLSAMIRKQLGLPKSQKGVVVTSVNPNSMAYEKGIRQGDLILEVNRQSVDNMNQFEKVTQKLKSGNVVLLSLKRQEASLIIAFELE